MAIIPIASCDREDAWDFVKTRGESVVEHKTLDVFNRIIVNNGINVVLNHGNTHSAVIEGWKNLMPKIILSVDNDGTLVIEDTNRFNFVRNPDNMTTVHLTYTGELNTVELSGNGNITSVDTMIVSSLAILCWGASGDVNLNVKTESVYIGTFDNVAPVTVGGFANSVGIINWGYNPYYLSGLETYYADIHHHGPTNVYVNASESLSVVVYGTGNVYYIGNPEITFTRKGKGNLLKY